MLGSTAEMSGGGNQSNPDVTAEYVWTRNGITKQEIKMHVCHRHGSMQTVLMIFLDIIQELTENCL